MIILHAGAENGRFWLWGERPADPAVAAGNAYPYDAGPQHLVSALITFAPGHSLPGGGKTPLLWAPTTAGVALPSSGVIADVPPAGKLRLRPYTITAFTLPAPLALDFLCACVGKEQLAPGVLIGSTLAFWVRLLQFAGAIVGREQFVPGLRPHDTTWRAAWQPVVAGPDSQRLGRLLRAMPAACRAPSLSADAPPDRPASEIASAFWRG